MSFYETFCDLCQKAGTTPTRAAMDMGISRALPSMWKKNGNTPQAAQLQKIADFFGVSVDYLLGAEKEKPAATEDDELKFALFGGDADKISDEALEEVLSFAQYVKQKELGK